MDVKSNVFINNISSGGKVSPERIEITSEVISELKDIVTHAQTKPTHLFNIDFTVGGYKSIYELVDYFYSRLIEISKDFFNESEGKITSVLSGNYATINWFYKMNFIRNFDINDHENIQFVGNLYDKYGGYFPDINVLCYPERVDLPIKSYEILFVYIKIDNNQKIYNSRLMEIKDY